MRKNAPDAVKYLLLFILLGAFSYQVAGCGLFHPPIHYVLPDGYVGMFKIVLDKDKGIDVERKGERYVYEIPPEGILKVKSFEPFYGSYEETAAYRDGKAIPTLSTVGDDAIALRDLGTSQRGDGPLTMAFVIGTKKQADKILEHIESSEFDKTPPQTYNQKLMQP